MKSLAFVCLLVVVGATFATSVSFAANEPRVSNHLGELLAEIVKNFTTALGDPMDVISELSIPIELSERDIVINGMLNISNVKLAGVSTLDITDAKATVIPTLGGDFKVKIPEIIVTGNYAMDAVVASVFPLPLHGAGPFSLSIREILAEAQVNLKIKSDLHLAVSELAYNVDLYELWIRLDGLFSDVDPSGELNEAVNIVLNSYLSILFNMYENSLHDQVVQLILFVANEVLSSLTLADLIGIIGGGSSK